VVGEEAEQAGEGPELPQGTAESLGEGSELARGTAEQAGKGAEQVGERPGLPQETAESLGEGSELAGKGREPAGLSAGPSVPQTAPAGRILARMESAPELARPRGGNPYVAGNAVGGTDAFVGREDVVRVVVRVLEQPQLESADRAGAPRGRRHPAPDQRRLPLLRLLRRRAGGARRGGDPRGHRLARRIGHRRVD
jgi:hypothetical protein